MLGRILITDPLSDKGISMLEGAGFEVMYKPKIDNEEIRSIIHTVDGWILRSGTKIKKDDIEHAKKLQIIGRAGVGTDNIDKISATQHGVVVMNVPDGNTISAAEHTMAMILSLSRNIQLGHLGLMKGEWNRHLLVGNEIRGKSLGVVGLGKIGREVIKRSLSYEMKILGFDPYVSQEQFNEEEVKIVELDHLIENSDFITLHIPINDKTRNLFNYDKLVKMKSSARIINVARGGIINEYDLATVLNEEKISGAAIDVFENEPIDSSNPLINAKNILLTPHLGASTIEAKESVTYSICKQMIDYFKNNKLTNALNMPIADISVMNRLSAFYELSDVMGKMQVQLSKGPIKKVEVLCYGSADDSKSIALSFVKGLLGEITDNRINFINADSIAKERGINFKHSYSNNEIPYSNIITVKVVSDYTTSISGSVYGKNHLRIIDIMGFKIDLKPEGNMLFIKNKDIPGVVGKVGTILGDNGINILGYLLSKVENKDFAYAVIKIKDKIDDELVDELVDISEILEIKQLSL